MSDDSGRFWYFAYGSNMWADQVRRRLGCVPPSRRARLKGWRLAFNKRSTKPTDVVFANIVPDAGGEVWGAAYDMPAGLLDEMDRWEGEGYRREEATVTDDAGRTLAAVAYVARQGFILPEQPPTDAYLKRILAGAREQELPEEYIASILAAAAG